jgi:hypothetical protein
MLPLSVWSAKYKWVAILIALGACYAWGRHDGSALAEADVLRENALVERAFAASQAGAAAEIAKLEIKHVTLQQRIERETREVPVYRDCRHSPDGLRSLNDALENRTVAPDDRQLPGDAGGTSRR